jgi:hypothetical protein
MLNDKIPFEMIQKDPDWFREDELHAFKIADDVEMRAQREEDFDTSGPITLQVTRPDKRMNKIADAYLRKVRKHVKKYVTWPVLNFVLL